MNKSAKYIILIAVLLVANLWLFFGENDRNSSFKDNQFMISEASKVEEIRISSEKHTINLTLSEGNWILNNTYKADAGFVNTLLTVFQKVRVVKVLGDRDGPVDGFVSFKMLDGENLSFSYVVDLNKLKSYFILDDNLYEVAVPGYRDNVVDLFMLHPDQWRNRLVFDGSWRTIQKVQVDYANGNAPFEIKFDDKFFLINGQSAQDSTAVIDFLNQFEYFQANEMMSKGRFPEFDSLSTTQPLATITLDDIKSEEPTVLTIFPRLNNQRYHLMVKDGEQQMVVDAGRVGAMLGRVE